MIYLTCYLGSCFFAYLDFRLEKNQKSYSLIFMAFAILIPCVLAGLRAPIIGTDVNVYVKPVIDSMKNSNVSLFTLLYNEIFVGETNGVLFTSLLYLCSGFKNSLFVALFFIEFLCLFPVYKVIQKQEFSSGLKALSLFCYFCFFYHLSLNLMKQCIAISLVFLGFDLLKKQKKLKYIFLVFMIALLVHKSAILALLVYIVYAISTNHGDVLLTEKFGIRISIEKRSSRRFKTFAFFTLLMLMLFLLLNIRSILSVLVVVKHSYIYQLSHLTSFKLKYSNFIVMMLILSPIIVFKRSVIRSDYKYRFYIYILVLSTLLYQFVGASPALYRLSLYTLIFIILAVPNFINLFKKDAKILATIYYVLILIVNFVFDVVLNSYAGVYPYSTSI